MHFYICEALYPYEDVPAIKVNETLSPPADSTFSQLPYRIVSLTGKRANYSGVQLTQLEHGYAVCNYAKGARKKEIAERLGLEKISVTKWFQNRRTRDRRNSVTSKTNIECTKNLTKHSTVPNQIDDVREDINVIERNHTKEEALRNIISYLTSEDCQYTSSEMMTSDDLDDVIAVISDDLQLAPSVLPPAAKKPKMEQQSSLYSTAI